ncbi:MAG: aminotransferase [Chitinophagaceae bacterium]|nr:aminotransferase [Chitinophagaceae bacterium]
MTGSKHAHHLYVVKSQRREDLSNHLKKNGIHTLIHYPVAVFKQQAYKGQFDEQAYPITNLLTEQVLSLPLFPGMTMQQLDQVFSCLAQFDR